MRGVVAFDVGLDAGAAGLQGSSADPAGRGLGYDTVGQGCAGESRSRNEATEIHFGVKK